MGGSAYGTGNQTGFHRFPKIGIGNRTGSGPVPGGPGDSRVFCTPLWLARFAWLPCHPTVGGKIKEIKKKE